MGWDQGPYPSVDDCVRTITLDDAARIVADEQIECVYGLFQVYEPTLWAPATADIRHDVWTLLRTLFAERERGAIDVPIVFHWGFDVHTLDAPVVQALDGQIFCNRELLKYWASSEPAGGRGLDLFGDAAVTAFFDGDRPKLEFMTAEFAEPLSSRTGEIHTVCVGRPFDIDALELARRGIHLHVYGNGFDDIAHAISRTARRHPSRRSLRSLREFVHVHASLQSTGRSWAEVQDVKSTWVREFSQYDAGWSYIGTPYPWGTLEDRAAIPNRLSTYVLAGLPVISDRRPGFYRYDELARLGVNIDLVGSDYDALAAGLATEVATRVKRNHAVHARRDYSFDASIDQLLEVLLLTRERYLAQPPETRRRGVAGDPTPLLQLAFSESSPRTSHPARRLMGKARAGTIGRYRDRQVERLTRELVGHEGAGGRG